MTYSRSIISALFLITLFHTSVSLASDSKALYIKNCSACHGQEGEGGKGPSLNRQSFLAIASENYLIKSIYYGRPTRGCPPRADLTGEEIKAIVSVVKSWQKAESVKVSDRRVLPSDSARGREIFNVCVGCHDDGGRGAMGPSLIDPGFQASATDAFLRGTILFGREGTPMNPFSKEKAGTQGLSEEDVDELIAYIRYLGKQKNSK